MLGFEFLNQTVKAKLGSEIESAIQKLCDVRDSEPDKSKRTDVMSRKITPVLKELGSILSNYYRIQCKVCNKLGIRDAYIQMYGPNDHKITKVIDDRWYQKPDIKPTTAEQLSKFNKSLLNDLYLGDTDLDKGDLLYGFRFDITVDFIGFLNTSNEISVGIEDFTAAEVTAIILHELGHFISLCKRFDRSKLAIQIAKEHYSYFNKYATPEEKKKFVQYQIALMGGKKDGPVPKEDLEAIEKIYDADIVIKGSILDLAGDVLRNILYTLGSLIFIAELLLMSILFYQIFELLNMFILKSIGSDKSKTDDYSPIERNLALRETEADSYAVVHGYGAALSTVLSKLNKSRLLMSFYTEDSVKSKYMYYLSGFISYFFNIVGNESTDTGYYTYEPALSRMKTIKSETIKYLKDSKLPRDMIQMYLSQIDEIEKNITNARNKSIPVKVGRIIVAIVSNIMVTSITYDIGVFALKTIFDRINDKIRNMPGLLRQIELLKNNDIYVASAKLRIMSNNK